MLTMTYEERIAIERTPAPDWVGKALGAGTRRWKPVIDVFEDDKYTTHAIFQRLKATLLKKGSVWITSEIRGTDKGRKFVRTTIS
jgi:hypothetical protein